MCFTYLEADRSILFTWKLIFVCRISLERPGEGQDNQQKRRYAEQHKASTQQFNVTRKLFVIHRLVFGWTVLVSTVCRVVPTVHGEDVGIGLLFFTREMTG